MYLEPNEYTNTARPGNKVQMDRLVAAAQQYPGTIEIRMRKHLGLNHQKTIWFHAQHVVAFGTSNWSDASDDNQLEANIFTDKVPGDPLNDFLFTELRQDVRAEVEQPRTRRLDRNRGLADADAAAADRADDLRRSQRDQLRRAAAVHVSAAATAAAAAPAGSDDDRGLSGEGRRSRAPRWQLAADPTAAGGTALWNPNANKAKVAPALAAPASYVERTFDAMAGTAYHVWVRLRAENDSLSNDSIHMQFSDSVTRSGAATQRIGTSSSAEFMLQDGPSGGAESGWGWADNGWGQPGALIYFAATGTHTLRIQQREDGPFVDQIVPQPRHLHHQRAADRATATRRFCRRRLIHGRRLSLCNDRRRLNNGGPAPSPIRRHRPRARSMAAAIANYPRRRHGSFDAAAPTPRASWSSSTATG